MSWPRFLFGYSGGNCFCEGFLNAGESVGNSCKQAFVCSFNRDLTRLNWSVSVDNRSSSVSLLFAAYFLKKNRPPRDGLFSYAECTCVCCWPELCDFFSVDGPVRSCGSSLRSQFNADYSALFNSEQLQTVRRFYMLRLFWPCSQSTENNDQTNLDSSMANYTCS